MFLKNAWYVAANDHEIGRKPLGRVLLGEPVVMYRMEDGTVVALEDRCVHRHLPLSMGKLVGDKLQCHYHGLQYDSTRHLRARSRPGHDPAEREDPHLSGGRALSLGVDLDGRSGARRSRQDHRLPLARRSRTGARARPICTSRPTGS